MDKFAAARAELSRCTNHSQRLPRRNGLPLLIYCAPTAPTPNGYDAAFAYFSDPPTGVKYANGSKVYQLPASRSIRLAKRGCSMAISIPRVEMYGAVVRAAR
jgi:hypothetical protein